MKYSRIDFNECGVTAEVSTFAPKGGVKEYNVILHVVPTRAPFEFQLERIQAALSALIERLPKGTRPVFIRYLLSDPANQAFEVMGLAELTSCAVSIIGQAPLDGTKVALWAYLQTDMELTTSSQDMFTLRHGAYEHIWTAQNVAKDGQGSLESTVEVLGDYSESLTKLGCTLEENCQRTWFFVRDVDVNYSGVVQGRNRIFDWEGLTTDTHFIASTGISGNNADPKVSVTMDAYAVKGIEREQITYLKAPEYLNPTAEYGVAFERGTAIVYGDRRHLLISGTASINNRGEVVHAGDIGKQAYRMLRNVEALVKEGGCTLADLTHIIIYLRDIADYAVVKEIFDEMCPATPKVIVQAAVCRPGWLIEMECMAIRADGDSRFAAL